MWRENSGKFVVFGKLGQFRRPQIRRFTPTIQTLRRSPRTELCNPNFGPPKISPICVSADHRTTEILPLPPRFPLFGRFQAELTRTSLPNPDVSISNAPFSPRNSFSSQFFGRKRIFDATFGQFPSDVSGHFCITF